MERLVSGDKAECGSSLRAAIFSRDREVAVVADATFDDWIVYEARSLPELQEVARQGRLDYVLGDVDLLLGLTASGDHRSCMKVVHQACIGARVVVMTTTDRVREAVDFVRMGADDYVTCPVTPGSVPALPENVIAVQFGPMELVLASSLIRMLLRMVPCVYAFAV